MDKTQQQKTIFTTMQPLMRTRLLLAGIFLVPYLRCIENGTKFHGIVMPPPDYFSAITNAREVNTFCDLIEATEDDGPLNLSDREVVMTYLLLLLMSYGLITPFGEKIADFILEEFPKDHRLKEFAAYRDFNLQKNDIFISRLGQALVGYPGFEQVKQALDALEC